MKFLRNALTAISRPALAADYLRFRVSQARYGGERVRLLPEENLVIGGLSGFSEFHSCVRGISAAERLFLTTFPFPTGPIVDIGANLGMFSLQMARRYPERAIHAFEPNPSTLAAMRSNFERNGFPSARAYAFAIAAHCGEISFQADPINRATTHIVQENPVDVAGEVRPVVRVPCVTLDRFVEDQGTREVGLLKVDVEGYEETVFSGAEHVLRSGLARVIYYEVCPELARRAGFAPDAASRRLLAHGYRLHVLDDRGKPQPADLEQIGKVKLDNWIALANGVSG